MVINKIKGSYCFKSANNINIQRTYTKVYGLQNNKKRLEIRKYGPYDGSFLFLS